MATDRFSRMQRRAFLKLTGAMTALRLTPRALAAPSRRISVIVDANDPIASSDPVQWAAGRLRNGLVNKGFLCDIVPSADHVQGSAFSIVVAGVRFKPGTEFPASGCSPRQSGESPSHTRASGGGAGDVSLCQRPTRIYLRAAGVGGTGSVLARSRSRIASNRATRGRARK